MTLEYADCANIFFSNLAIKLSEKNNINKYVNELIKSKQFFLESIYSLDPVKLETLKIYIETYFKTKFIWLFKLLVQALIIFDKKFDGCIYFYINYHSLNNLTIKN